MTHNHQAELADAISNTIAKLAKKDFKTDPIMTSNSSLAVSRISSAYKRHGNILEKALISAINRNSKYIKAWEGTFYVPGWGKSKMQVDLITYNSTTKEIQAYELKRGGGNQYTSSVKSIKKRLKCLNSYLPVYAKEREYNITSHDTFAIAFYGELGDISPHRVLTLGDLNNHFECKVTDFLEEVNEYYKFCLHRVVLGNFAYSLEEFGIELEEKVHGVVHEKSKEKHPWDELLV